MAITITKGCVMINLTRLALSIQKLFLDTLDIKFNGSGIEFDLFGEPFKTDGETYTHLYKDYNCQGDVSVDNDILEYISIKIMYHHGMSLHPEAVVDISQIRNIDYNKLKKFSERIKMPMQVAYEGLINQSGSAAHISNILNLNKTFVKNVRSINRRNMIKVATEKAFEEFSGLGKN